ncbi:hypothetical protein K4K50_000958 [Colletotrichum sp. SAR 10_71]|nr:hypothetical protein K4K50_000958 [Colletotrichum sp. SAR 10_71]KAI8183279.1 hypothetical protein K4K51_000313 [Colletotrichum sp. SAR 10_75]KAI8193261.1 hypothetical protein KHU50_012618 [Colletotrichum sp. SAR 10_65]KAJ5002700.1 hypothetical protein K4K48_013063 [Colletotrichum sp. SAR 10_66]
MRFDIAIITATLAAGCAADRMVATYYCEGRSCWYRGEYSVNSGRKFTFVDWGGCNTRGIPEMAEFCIDYGKSRAHFRFNHQNKRCLRVTATRASGTITEWSEVGCNWRRDEDVVDEVDEGSEYEVPIIEESK